MVRFLYLCVLCLLALPYNLLAQQGRFITLDNDLLTGSKNNLIVAESFLLPEDYQTYTYEANIEFPEFELLPIAVQDSLRKSEAIFPEIPTPITTYSIGAKQAHLVVSVNPFVFRNGMYQLLRTCKVAVTRYHKNLTRLTDTVEDESIQQSILAEGRFVKIMVNNTGVVKLTHKELAKMGFSNPSKVRVYGYGGYLLSQSFAEQPAYDLPEVPAYHNSESILFYARGSIDWTNLSNGNFTRTRNFYSDCGYYFLTESGTSPMEFPKEALLTVEPELVLQTSDAFVLYEKDEFFWLTSGAELYDGYDYLLGNQQSYTLNLPRNASDKINLNVAFSAKSVDVTSLDVLVGDKNIGSVNIRGISPADHYRKAREANRWFTATDFKGENITVKLTHNRKSGASGRLNYLIANYTQHLQLSGGYLNFCALESRNKVTSFVVSGANQSTMVWDVTDAAHIFQMEGIFKNDTFTFTIPASQKLRKFVAVNPQGANFLGAEVIGEVANQNLQSLSDVDMIIITPDRSDFVRQAERLATAHRDYDKLKVSVVTSSQVYNEFSSGTPDATAYRRLMKMLYDKAKTEEERPKYLLLFGDAAHDNRMLSATWKNHQPSNFLLSYQFQESTNETESYLTDDYFGFLDDNEGLRLNADRLDIGIGRFPVRTALEAEAVVNKTISYIKNEFPGPWKRNICFVADDAAGDKSNNGFMQHAIDLADTIRVIAPAIYATRILEDAYQREGSAVGYSYPQAIKLLHKVFNDGTLVLNYIGHSGTTSWSDERLLTSSDVANLASPHLPVWFTASCEFSRFDEAATSAGELALLNPQGGAIALVSAARIVYDTQNYYFNLGFNHYLFQKNNGKRMRLGDIFRLAKSHVFQILKDDRDYLNTSLLTDFNKLNFNLTGDPAVTLSYPDYQFVIDEFDGPLTEEIPFMKAGAKIKVKGHILTPEGTPADDFTGLVYPFVYDNEETITTLDNVGKGSVSYKDHVKQLFSSIDSVRNGKFEFTIPVPLDINYSNENGLLSLYACSSDSREAMGLYKHFIVGGTIDNLVITNKGPEISMFLNTPDFSAGGKVNETPYFVANLEDEEGINTVGNGVGHDLSLCIDGKTTYSLNDYYKAVSGSYTKGSVSFSIPELPEGRHQLAFRAWDIMNNSTTKILDFEVVHGLKPDLFAVSCTQSPAKEQTTFILTHNRPGATVEVSLIVYDFAGREMWVHTENGMSAGQYYYVDWNLCSNAGQRLFPGVYFYRAILKSSDCQSRTQSDKIVILAQ